MSTAQHRAPRQPSLWLNSGLTLAQHLTGLGLSLLASILVARTLGPFGQGTYTMVTLATLTLTTLLDLGITPATVYATSQRHSHPRTVIANTLRLALTLSLLLFAGLAAFVVLSHFGTVPTPSTITSIPLALLLLGCAAAPFYMLHNLLLAVLQGLQWFGRYNIAALLPRAVLLALLVALVYVGEQGITGAVTAFASAALIAVVATAGLLPEGRRILHLMRQRSQAHDRAYRARVWRYGLRAYVGNVLALLNYRTDTFVLAAFTDLTSVGIYAVAVGLAERLWVLSQATSTTLMPRISQLADDNAARSAITPEVARWVLWLMVLTATLVGVASPVLAPWLYGPAYTRAASALVVLLPGIVLQSHTRILAHDLAGRGRPGLNAWIGLATLIVNAAACLVLVPGWGILGAACASSLAYGCSALLTSIVYCRIAGVPWWRFVRPAPRAAMHSP